MTRRYRGCYRGPWFKKVKLLGGRLVLSVRQRRRDLGGLVWFPAGTYKMTAILKKEDSNGTSGQND